MSLCGADNYYYYYVYIQYILKALEFLRITKTIRIVSVVNVHFYTFVAMTTAGNHALHGTRRGSSSVVHTY